MFKSIKTGHITLLLCMLSIGLNNLFFSQQFGQFIESSQSVYLPFTITNYNTKHGLPQNQVEDIVQKSNRELIIATANGIVAFDGTSFRNFINDKNHIESFYARVFCDKATNKLYGLGREQLFSQISPTYKPIKYFTAICQYQNRFFGITPKGTLYVCYPKNNKVIAIAQTNSKWVGGLHYDGKSFYIITAKQLIKFDYKSKETKTFKVERLHSVYRNPCNKQLYFVGYTNVFQIKKNSIQELFDKDKYSDFQFNDIEFTEDNEMYVATSKGLIYSGYGYTEVYDQKDMLPSENLRSLYYDEVENCLFVGSGNKGFFKFQLKNANTMSQYPDIGTSSLSSVVQTKNGNIYVCSSQHTLYEIGYDYARPICNVKASVASLSIIDNELWIGTWGSGIYRVKNDKIIDSITLPQLTTNVVHGAYKDSKGTIWVSNLHGLKFNRS